MNVTVRISSKKFLPYGRQHVTDEDIRAVTDVLRSDWLTQGPAVPAFEEALALKTKVSHAVACASGTAALHLAMLALGIGSGDAVVTSPITFLASANCARFVGAEVRFADVDPSTGLMDPDSLKAVLATDVEKRIKAVIPVHLAGQPCDMVAIHELCSSHGAALIEDACHAIGSSYQSDGDMVPTGSCKHSDMTVFSFHPVKHVAMGEGGAITTNDTELANRLRLFRNHGMQKHGFSNEDMAYASDGEVNPWYYEMHELGYNYRLTDIQAALGKSQLERLDWSVDCRNKLADRYRTLIAEAYPDDEVLPLATRPGIYNAHHLFVVRIDFDEFRLSRADVMRRLRESGIGTQVHYIPVHLQPYYRQCTGLSDGDLPGAEEYYRHALSLPMYPDLTESDVERVVAELSHVLKGA